MVVRQSDNSWDTVQSLMGCPGRTGSIKNDMVIPPQPLKESPGCGFILLSGICCKDAINNLSYWETAIDCIIDLFLGLIDWKEKIHVSMILVDQNRACTRGEFFPYTC